MTQKELKKVYEEELRKAWSTEEMIVHCSKTTDFVVEHNGMLYGIEKPRIETRFCFSHGMYGVTTEEDESRASRMAEMAKQSKEYFINENLKDIDRSLESLRNVLRDMNLNWAEGSHPIYMVETGKHYYSQTEDCRLRYYSVVNTFNRVSRGEICNDTELLEKLILGYEEVRNKFIKRLNTYLKRYGLSKVESWTFVSD